MADLLLQAGVAIAALAYEFIAPLTVSVFLYYSTRRYHRALRRFRLPARIRAAIVMASLAVPLIFLVSYATVLLVVEARQFIEEYALVSVASENFEWFGGINQIPEFTVQGLYDAYQSGERGFFYVRLGESVVERDVPLCGFVKNPASKRIVGALRAGRYTADVSIDPIDLDDPCPRCGGAIRVTYEDEHVRMQCEDCEDWGNQFTFPPGTIEQFDREALPEAFDRWLGTTIERTVAGFCPNCSGRLEGRLRRDDDRFQNVAATYGCDRCGDVAHMNPAALLFAHPAAVAFYHDHGIDVRSTPTWVIDRESDQTVEFVDDDPPRVRVGVTIDGERLVAMIDEEASVESVERTPA